MPRTLPFAHVALFFVFAGHTGCGGDEGGTCVATLCDPGAPAVCSGHDLRKCTGDGKRYTYEACGAQERCDDASGTASCVPRQCTNLGVATCASPTSVVKCLDDGSALETTPCSDGERCNDGVCVSTSCVGNDSVCTAHGFLTCANGAWTSGTCGVGQVCSRVNGGAACSAPVCVGGSFSCEGQVSKECDARGTSAVGTTCGKGESCVSGRCQPTICGVDAGDATGSDGGDSSAPTAQITFKIDGVAETFDQTAIADFDAGKKLLTLRASKSNRELRILLENARATATGHFASDVFSTTKVTVCYNDGGAPQVFDRCPDGFTDQSTAYVVDISSNAGAGSRIVGTFEATVNDENGDATAIVDGAFSLNYR